jgi:hypothetical protein
VRKSLQDDELKGRSSASRIQESMEVIQKCVTEAQTLSVRLLEEITGINRDTT